MSSDFEPRLLLPGAPGIPSHMRVSHDIAVFNELADRSVSAVIWVPRWSEPVQQAFRHIARQQVKRSLCYQDQVMVTPDEQGKTREHDFLTRNIQRWLEPASNLIGTEKFQPAVDEIVWHHQVFLETLEQQKSGCGSELEVNLSRMAPKISFMNSLFLAPPPAPSFAHRDPDDVGLFASPVGTVLVDQDKLDLSLVTDTDNELPAKHCANRLWQVPDNSFLVLRGLSSENPQYHFFPPVSRNLLRFRLFAFPC